MDTKGREGIQITGKTTSYGGKNKIPEIREIHGFVFLRPSAFAFSVTSLFSIGLVAGTNDAATLGGAALGFLAGFFDGSLTGGFWQSRGDTGHPLGKGQFRLGVLGLGRGWVRAVRLIILGGLDGGAGSGIGGLGRQEHQRVLVELETFLFPVNFEYGERIAGFRCPFGMDQFDLVQGFPGRQADAAPGLLVGEDGEGGIAETGNSGQQPFRVLSLGRSFGGGGKRGIFPNVPIALDGETLEGKIRGKGRSGLRRGRGRHGQGLDRHNSRDQKDGTEVPGFGSKRGGREKHNRNLSKGVEENKIRSVAETASVISVLSKSYPPGGGMWSAIFGLIARSGLRFFFEVGQDSLIDLPGGVFLKILLENEQTFLPFEFRCGQGDRLIGEILFIPADGGEGVEKGLIGIGMVNTPGRIEVGKGGFGFFLVKSPGGLGKVVERGNGVRLDRIEPGSGFVGLSQHKLADEDFQVGHVFLDFRGGEFPVVLKGVQSGLKLPLGEVGLADVVDGHWLGLFREGGGLVEGLDGAVVFVELETDATEQVVPFGHLGLEGDGLADRLTGRLPVLRDEGILGFAVKLLVFFGGFGRGVGGGDADLAQSVSPGALTEPGGQHAEKSKDQNDPAGWRGNKEFRIHGGNLK